MVSKAQHIVNPLLPPWVLLVDAETTSLDRQRGAPIEIGVVKCGECRIFGPARPHIGAVVDADALAVNGWTFGGLEALQVSQKQLVEELVRYLASDDEWEIAGMNPDFDRDFLVAAIARYVPKHRRPRISHRVHDLHTLVGHYYPQQRRLNSVRIAGLLGLPPEPEQHTALGGLQWEALAFRKLHENRDILLGVGQSPDRRPS
jgi:DNA polymerase III epsilon subunit-like protein